jgi:RNA polymerase sigma-54 factor
MIQSMEILQLPVMALEERIREEVERNETLELGTSPTETPLTDLEANFPEAVPEGTAPPSEGTMKEGSAEQVRDEIEKMYEEWNENFTPNHVPTRLAGIEMSDKKNDAMQNMADRAQSLEDHLLEQISFEDDDPVVVEFSGHIVANLNERGFLNIPFEEIVASFEKPVTPQQAERALQLVQGLDPLGVGARDLRECLLLQLRDEHPTMKHVDVLRTILTNHYDDLQHNRLPVIERKPGISMAVITEAIEELRHLDLNPGGRFTSTKSQYVIPDVVVALDENGEFVIKMNDDSTPRVFIRKDYQQMIQQRSCDPSTLEYLKRKITAARWLLESIEQRRNTLEKVTRAILEHQREFLERGPDHIEPLKMQQIADRVGVHVTTVSRAVDDKWVQTPRGIFPLRRFFGGGTVTASGEEVAWDTIKRRLTEVVNGEDKTNPYSDDELVKKLSELGYPLARRTVTKYRKMLDIPSSRQRKQHV